MLSQLGSETKSTWSNWTKLQTVANTNSMYRNMRTYPASLENFKKLSSQLKVLFWKVGYLLRISKVYSEEIVYTYQMIKHVGAACNSTGRDNQYMVGMSVAITEVGLLNTVQIQNMQVEILDIFNDFGRCKDLKCVCV